MLGLLCVADRRLVRFRVAGRFQTKPSQQVWAEYMGRLFGHAHENAVTISRNWKLNRLPRAGAPGASLLLVNPEDPPDKQAAPLLPRYDKYKNGKLSRTEIGFDEATFKALDTNKDGQLDAAELAAWFKQPPDLELAVPLN